MEKNPDEVIKIFRDSGALLEGHFILRSGLHSAHFSSVRKFVSILIKLRDLQNYYAST